MANVEQLETFFKLVFGNLNGYMVLAFLDSITKEFTERFYSYPNNVQSAAKDIVKNREGNNVYFCPHIFGSTRRKKDAVSYTPVVWSDLDDCPPSKLMLTPSLILETSPDRYQALWFLDDPETAPSDAEALSKRIAYHHKADGADISGWDLTQLLRVPFTYNYKYDKFPQVNLISASRTSYSIKDFEPYPELVDYKFTTDPVPSDDELEPLDEIIRKYRSRFNDKVWDYFSLEPKTATDWSKPLWNLEMMLFESGMSKEQVYVVATEAKCNKYRRDHRPVTQLWKEVCRAYDHHQMGKEITVKNPETISPLLSSEERASLENLESTFVERYIAWASSLSDAATQYHQAGAFVLLSSLLSGSLLLNTSYGKIVPNLWFMILADTTITRKSTAMDIAMDMLEEIDSSAMLATDGSVEGLLNGLVSRPRKPSVFLRDEVSGMLEAMFRKDYMAGMAETFTKLYDGKFMKRILRKESFEIREPRLIMFTGGIKNKVTNLLTHEHIGSGFIPRFIFITADSDPNKIRPIGPPNRKVSAERELFLTELREMKDFYAGSNVLSIGSSGVSIEMPKETEVFLTEDAWIRYNKLEADLVNKGLNSPAPDIYTPVGDRLAKSILKSAMLLSATKKLDDTITIEIEDILRAIKYGEIWYQYAVNIIEDIGKNSEEHLLDRIYKFILSYSINGVSRSTIMKAFHLQSRQTRLLMETLEDRDLVSFKDLGKGMMYVSTSV